LRGTRKNDIALKNGRKTEGWEEKGRALGKKPWEADCSSSNPAIECNFVPNHGCAERKVLLACRIRGLEVEKEQNSTTSGKVLCTNNEQSEHIANAFKITARGKFYETHVRGFARVS